jgi:hypothetical protein
MLADDSQQLTEVFAEAHRCAGPIYRCPSDQYASVRRYMYLRCFDMK